LMILLPASATQYKWHPRTALKNWVVAGPPFVSASPMRYVADAP
jgi:hypothetical protein